MSLGTSVVDSPRSVVRRPRPDAAGRPADRAEPASVGTSDGTHPFVRYVNPHLGDLLSRLRLDKRFVRGKGSELVDETGRRYLDCISAYGALPFGFNPPDVWAALREVRLNGEPSLVQPSLLDAAGELAARLVAVAPGDLRHVTFANSGAEAVEAGIKICRAATGRPGVLSTDNSFHGKTLGALSATGNAKYQQGFAAPAEGFETIPFGDAEALREAVTRRPDHFAAFIVEPIQGEGGIVEPQPGYLKAVREICTAAGVLLVFDEIQTGLGRTGRLFACEREGVAPDVMTLAKALGGGLLPIGAVLCTPAAYTEAFALKHSSTFAGNALACRAGLAVMDRLTRGDGALLRRVRRNGARLKRGLLRLRSLYPHLLAEVRGRGYMLGLRFHADRARWPDGLLGVAADQDFFTPIFASYLLNVEGIRVAPTLNGNSVIRIEPALNFTRAQCERLLDGLGRALEAFSEGDAGRVFGSILDGEPRPRSVRIGGAATVGSPDRPLRIEPEREERRFAFLVHPLDVHGYTEFDSSLASLTEGELADVTARISGLVEPFVLSRARVVSEAGRSVYGEFIALPWTAEQLAAMPTGEAVAVVRQAVRLAAGRGAQLVGLGAFTSIVTRGGLSVSREGVPVTTGNSYTAVAAAEAVGHALRSLGESLGGHRCAAVLGSTGAIGRAMALLLSEEVGRLVLVGNPERTSDAVRRRLLGVTSDICRRAAVLSRQGRRIKPGTVMARLLELGAGETDPDAPAESYRPIIERLERDGVVVLTQDLDSSLPLADVVVAATSATGSVVASRHLRPGAVVCDLSRPANVSPEVARARPDVLVIDGGVIAVPGRPALGPIGVEPGLAYACMAETMMLALEGRLENMSLGVDLSSENLLLVRSLADRHGFRVARLRSNGRVLGDADWNRLLDARRLGQIGQGREAA